MALSRRTLIAAAVAALPVPGLLHAQRLGHHPGQNEA